MWRGPKVVYRWMLVESDPPVFHAVQTWSRPHAALQHFTLCGTEHAESTYEEDNGELFCAACMARARRGVVAHDELTGEVSEALPEED